MRFPDFIIGGMQKCGTTTLHHLLEAHPQIYIPKQEIHYFDADDPLSHPTFYPFENRMPGKEDYAQFFSNAPVDALIGEDSSTYLSSASAPARIQSLLPQAKLIFSLRDPVDRAYSHYWHLVATGRVNETFERVLDIRPSIINNSTYVQNLGSYRTRFDQVKVVLFEEMVRDMQHTCDEICDFLRVARFSAPEIHSNRTLYPTRLTWAMNRIGKHVSKLRTDHHFDTAKGPKSLIGDGWTLMARKTLIEGRKPPMNPETRERLSEHLSFRNSGLSEMLGKDLSTVWTNFRNV